MGQQNVATMNWREKKKSEEVKSKQAKVVRVVVQVSKQKQAQRVVPPIDKSESGREVVEEEEEEEVEGATNTRKRFDFGDCRTARCSSGIDRHRR